ncbi:MAG: galactokinase [Verrucomicrobia bacterium]|jgi:galactokinase|nr:galactokinase [Verrucomicrobiota bacterium]
MNDALYKEAADKFKTWYGCEHTAAAYAPGRVEVLGNHTDYNEGFVLSAAINMGIFCLAAPSPDNTCRIVAGDLMKEASFDIDDASPDPDNMWANYVKGVFVGLRERCNIPTAFNLLFFSNVPLGSGLSSSAALEIGSGLCFCSLYDVEVPKLDMALIGQAAEHNYAGVMCGVMDQISSLYGKANQLVKSDFRSLEVENTPLGEDLCFLVCNTNAKHALVDGAYNERRQKCEEAAAFFAGVLDHPVTALRDVSMEEWTQHAPSMETYAAKRSAHVVGENTRVQQGSELLQKNDVAGFGQLMFDSHQSSIENFENSCEELDFIVGLARQIPGALGARLSGGGFGGSAVVLVHPRDVETVGQAISGPYEKQFGHPCDVRMITPSEGAHIVV